MEKHALGWGKVGKEGGRKGKSIAPRHSSGTVKIQNECQLRVDSLCVQQSM